MTDSCSFSLISLHLLITEQCGNSYCGSLYAGLLSLVSARASELPGSRVLMFSYGSGLAATLFSLQAYPGVARIRDVADVTNRLAARTPVDPSSYTAMLAARETTHALTGFRPHMDPAALFKGTYYLKHVDGRDRRSYARHFSSCIARAARWLRK